MAAVKRTCQLPELDEDMGGSSELAGRRKTNEAFLLSIHLFNQRPSLRAYYT